LKRAVVGGIERVFEINRNFRNEGADSTHSPEFAMLEAYQAYGDYGTMMDLTQKLIQNAAQDVFGTQVVSLDDGEQNDLSGDWARVSMFESLSSAAGQEITPTTPMAELKKIADKVEIEIDHPLHGKYVEELWEHFVKPTLKGPTFVVDFPVDTSPLTRDHRDKPGVVEKWDLYVRGYEQATGYSELVDPVIQRERFVAQAALGKTGDPEAMKLDEEFLKALEFGMPPSGGMGMGIDRLLMSLTGLGIRETILFPLVK
jgi:lysyl-tRNA synthetase class 2